MSDDDYKFCIIALLIFITFLLFVDGVRSVDELVNVREQLEMLNEAARSAR